MDITRIDAQNKLTKWTINAEGIVLSHYCPIDWVRITDCNIKTPCVVLVPGQDIVLHHVELPRLRRKERLPAIIYSLEERILGNLELLHFAYAEPVGNSKWPIAVVDCEKMDIFLSKTERLGLAVDVMVPDYLALVWHPSQWTVYIDEHIAMVRMGKFLGFTIEREHYQTILMAYLNDMRLDNPEIILLATNYMDVPEEMAALCVGIPIQQVNVESMWDFSSFSHHTEFNLLQERYRPKLKIKSRHRTWRFVLMLAFGLLVSVTGSIATQFLLLTLKQHQNRHALALIYKDIFPNSDPMIKSEGQLSLLLRKVGQSKENGDFIILLQIVAKALTNHPELILTKIQYQNASLTVEMHADHAETVSRFNHTIQKNSIIIINKKVKSATSGYDCQLVLRRLAS